jgi:hypothetical protein
MSGTDARGRTHSQPLTAPVVTLDPTTPKPDKSQAQFALTVEIGRAAARSQVLEALGSGARSRVRRQPR